MRPVTRSTTTCCLPDGAASPTNLTTGTSYFVIKVDDNTIQLALSLFQRSVRH